MRAALGTEDDIVFVCDMKVVCGDLWWFSMIWRGCGRGEAVAIDASIVVQDVGHRRGWGWADCICLYFHGVNRAW